MSGLFGGGGIVPVIPGHKNELDNYYEMVHCTQFGLQTAAYAGNRWAYVFNPATGKPVSVPVSLTVSNYNGTVISNVNTGVTAPDSGRSRIMSVISILYVGSL